MGQFSADRRGFLVLSYLGKATRTAHLDLTKVSIKENDGRKGEESVADKVASRSSMPGNKTFGGEKFSE